MTSRPSAQLILASGSATRRAMLQAAGVDFEVIPANIDEAEIRRHLIKAVPPEKVAEALATGKAVEVSRLHPEALVIGADQVLNLAGKILTKPSSVDDVRTTLQSLSGRTHTLHSTVTLALNWHKIWSSSDTAQLTMRRLTPSFIDDYISRVGATVQQSVGAYQIEGLGLQLFDAIEGDYFTILGMPLLPLLGELRAQGVLAT